MSIPELMRKPLPVLVICCALLSAQGCATAELNLGAAPPVLSLDEVMRPYYKVGVVEVRRNRYGDRSDITSQDYNWAEDALRAEAAKIKADAVIFPEMSVTVHHFLFFPRSEMKAKGTAIRFR